MEKIDAGTKTFILFLNDYGSTPEEISAETRIDIETIKKIIEEGWKKP